MYFLSCQSCPNSLRLLEPVELPRASSPPVQLGPPHPEAQSPDRGHRGLGQRKVDPRDPRRRRHDRRQASLLLCWMGRTSG
jgi:hypothetical protein